MARKTKPKETKGSTANTLRIPAVNKHGEFGRWDFLEICDPWDAAKGIRQFVEKRVQTRDKPSLPLKAFT